MENAVDDVPDYMVAVKSEFLVKIHPKNNNCATLKELVHSEVHSSATTVDQNAHSSTLTDASGSILEPVNQVDAIHLTVDGISEGYKSNGYKLDDRDKQRMNNWDNKKDYTGGKDPQGSKKRPRDSRPESSERLCSYIAKSVLCPWGQSCEYSHNPIEFLSNKLPDIDSFCYQYSVFGECQNGIMCRYGGHHINYEAGISLKRPEEEGGVLERVIINPLTKEVQSQLRKKKYNFKARTDGDQAVAAAVAAKESKSLEERSHSAISTPTEAVSVASIPETDVPPKKALKTDESPVTSIIEAEILSIDDVTDQSKTLLQEEDLKPTHLRKEEIKRDFNFTAYPQKMKLVDFSNKVYIAPLTTVGNLPWRRVMKDFGADITCGEMAMSHNLVMGQASEWARIRRHPSEDCFGIQVAGGQPEHMTKIAKLLENETSSDFVDLNCGCPLDTICNRGCGASLLNKPKKLVEIVSTMTKALTSRQVTVKIRTGWDDKNPMAHKLIPMLQKTAKGRIAAIMIHGRSRLQRYSKLANWEYVLQAARSQDPNLPRIPIIGNGDIFSWDDWHGHCDKIQSDVTGGSDNEDPEIVGLTSCAMLGRGALIKPWLPMEIKEKRNIDIPATERLDMLKKFVNYGLEHWGSDTQGVATTRSFLLEWLSFLHRYVPVGLTERTQKMQQRPPQFYGRCDLETLLGSGNSNDWVRISEMLLGPVGDDFHFVAKHKSSSYAAEVGESNG